MKGNKQRKFTTILETPLSLNLNYTEKKNYNTTIHYNKKKNKQLSYYLNKTKEKLFNIKDKTILVFG